MPTRNEHDNVRPVYDALCRTLEGIDWEAIFVDDDSQDGTPEAVCRLASLDRRVRCIQRIGRRGLASACVEGILASSAPYVAVMDADLQHDEQLLPQHAQDIEDRADRRRGGRQSLCRAREHWHLEPAPRVAEQRRHSHRARRFCRFRSPTP